MGNRISNTGRRGSISATIYENISTVANLLRRGSVATNENEEEEAPKASLIPALIQKTTKRRGGKNVHIVALDEKEGGNGIMKNVVKARKPKYVKTWIENMLEAILPSMKEKEEEEKTPHVDDTKGRGKKKAPKTVAVEVESLKSATKQLRKTTAKLVNVKRAGVVVRTLMGVFISYS